MLSEEQEDFLLARTADIDRMASLHSLMRLAVTVPTPYLMKGFETTLQVGQCAASKVELATLWKCNRKTVARMLAAMNRLGLVRSVSNNRTSVHTLLCLSGWLIDGQMLRNPFYQRPNANSAANVDSRNEGNVAAKRENDGAKATDSNGAPENLQSLKMVDTKQSNPSSPQETDSKDNDEPPTQAPLTKEDEKAYQESLADYYAKRENDAKESHSDAPKPQGTDASANPSSSLH